MKIKIEEYPDRLVCNLYGNYMTKKYGYMNWPRPGTPFERSLEWFETKIQDVYTVLNQMWFNSSEQKSKIQIDPWDTWSMDSTLAMIVVPMLIQLKETKQGAPLVDPQDVPLELQPKKQNKKQKRDGETDSTHFERWDWVLDEMIFSFESKLDDCWMEQFYSGESYSYFQPLTDGMGLPVEWKELSEWKSDLKDTFEVDREGAKAYQDRMSNGFRLFGKYYENLWS